MEAEGRSGAEGRVYAVGRGQLLIRAGDDIDDVMAASPGVADRLATVTMFAVA